MEAFDIVKLAGGIGAAVFLAVLAAKKFTGGGKVNQKIAKHEEKVVSKVDIEDLGDCTAFCRCWKSSKFPYCDGSHNNHNKTCSDNVGPLLVNRDQNS